MKNKDSDGHVINGHDEYAEYYKDLYGDVIAASEEEELEAYDLSKKDVAKEDLNEEEEKEEVNKEETNALIVSDVINEDLKEELDVKQKMQKRVRELCQSWRKAIGPL